MSDVPMFYFGCWDRPGHFLFTPAGRMVHAAGPFEDGALNATFPPHMPKPGGRYNEIIEDETIAVLAHVQGWTVMAMWDRSVDTRGKCNAAFVAPGEHTHREMWALARDHFPQIVLRLKAAPKDLP